MLSLHGAGGTGRLIATIQALIAVSMIMKNRIFNIGAIGAIIFLIAILPLGVGSVFPCTLMVAALVVLLR